MFQRYTQHARRSIFFGRFEASHYGCSHIETQHLLLGLLRADQALAKKLLSLHDMEWLRKEVDGHSERREKVSTATDLPLSDESKRALSYGMEEGERLGHKHIGTEHLLLGLMREEGFYSAQLLRERGLTLESVRARVQQPDAD